ncbi:hypothetical protein M8J75_005393 [Diaphorina citri]|nr:hypothetical protein M8J75_005393 [Diaphorina citri]
MKVHPSASSVSKIQNSFLSSASVDSKPKERKKSTGYPDQKDPIDSKLLILEAALLIHTYSFSSFTPTPSLHSLLLLLFIHSYSYFLSQRKRKKSEEK